MSYVAGFRCDVFVSYAFVDDEAMTGQKPWVTTFANDLKVLLKRTLGARTDDDLKMFFTGHHGSLEAGLDLEEELKKNAGSTAAFISITSPAYVTPDSWTMKELNAFQTAMGETGRVFVIELMPLGGESYPDSINRLTRLPFWDKRPPRGIPTIMEPGSETYTQTLIDLSLQISGQLRTMREKAQSAAAAPAAAATASSSAATNGSSVAPPLAGKAVYLAQVTDDLNDERNQVRRYLEPFGVEVLPQGIYPQGGDAFKAAVEADMARADAFVQLLGRAPALRPPDLAQGYDRAQLELAEQRDLPMLQWLHPDVDLDAVSDEMHTELLNRAVRGTLESFKADIVKRLEKQKPETEEAAEGTPPQSDQFIFIDADTADLPIANQLLEELESKQITAAVPFLEGDAADVRQDLEENLVECHALVMVYGSTTPVWVRGHLRLYSKLRHRREQPLKALAIYVGPPEDKPPQIGMKTVPEVQTLTPEEISKFVSGLYQ